jgi:hypothetical protein
MSSRTRKSVSWVACFAIAVHAILFGASMQPAGAAIDPFSVICHGGPAADSRSEPAPTHQIPTKACDHCSLCFAAAALAGPDAIPAGRLAPPSVLRVLIPASSAAIVRVGGAPNLARGPPGA